AMLAEGRGDNVKGVAMISPNFRVANPAAAVLTFPAARTWVPALFGADRSFEPMNEGHAKWWTTAYPSTALFPMAAIVKHAFEADYASVGTPALFLFADSDQVVDHRATREVASKWGGEVTIETVVPGAGDDPLHHVISGDILSPGMNDKTVDILLNWIEGL
ncbi:MAG: alpha/beta hydrolase, partial [Boseongicola sp.]|nr:alpha/beta hydrolase [Boseongicola sp.]